MGGLLPQPLRSIPACAGEPDNLRWRRPGFRVYPRVCGGTLPGVRSTILDDGLSPRVRGNPPPAPRPAAAARSIPACAGEPPFARQWQTLVRVYPRVCGGTMAWCKVNGLR